MELIEPKSLSYATIYKIVGNIFVPGSALGLLAMIALQFSRYSGSLERIALGSITIGVGVIGFSYYNFRRGLNQLEGETDDKVLSRLCHSANAMAMFGFMICFTALIFVAHH
jgi:hypothetical protein